MNSDTQPHLTRPKMFTMQVVLFGLVTAGLVLSNAAYEPLERFKAQTGLSDVQYLYDKRTDTHVRRLATMRSWRQTRLRLCSFITISSRMPVAMTLPTGSLPQRAR